MQYNVDVSRVPVPIRGMRYQPAPTDYIGNQGNCGKYFGSDFFNEDFPGFWSRESGGRGDIANMTRLGVNFVAPYNWDPARAKLDAAFAAAGLGKLPTKTRGGHVGFLDECSANTIEVAVPFSNPFAQNVTSWGAQGVFQIMQEIGRGDGSPHPAVCMWTIANEYNQGGGPSAAQIAKIAQVILFAETKLGWSGTSRLPIASPTSYAPADSPGIAPTKVLRDAFSATTSFTVTINGKNVEIPALPDDFFTTRYVVATNPQNPGSSPPGSPSPWTIAGFIDKAASAFPGSPIWFSEVGIGISDSCNGWPGSCKPGLKQQATFVSNQISTIEALRDKNKGHDVLGCSVFEYTPDYQNPVGSVNYTFSVLDDDHGKTANVEFRTPKNAACSPACGGITPCSYSQDQPYPVQCLRISKPLYAAIEELWNDGGTSPEQFCAKKNS